MFCRFKRKMISAFLDDELSEKDRKKIIEHTKQCVKCEEYLESLRKNNLLIHQYAAVSDKYIPEIPWSNSVSVIRSLTAVNKDTIEERSGIKIVKEQLFHYISIPFSRFFARKEEKIDPESVSKDGVVSVSITLRLISALLTALAIILLYSQKLNSTIV